MPLKCSALFWCEYSESREAARGSVSYRLSHKAWIIFQSLIAAAAGDTVICLFFTLVLVECWPSSSSRGNMVAYACLRRVPSNPRNWGWRPATLLREKWGELGFSASFKNKRKWLFMKNWVNKEDDLAYFAWMCVRGEDRRRHTGCLGELRNVWRLPSGRGQLVMFKQPGFSATVVFILCVLAFICWNASSSQS